MTRYIADDMPNPISDAPQALIDQWRLQHTVVASHDTGNCTYEQWVLKNPNGTIVVRGVGVHQHDRWLKYQRLSH